MSAFERALLLALVLVSGPVAGGSALETPPEEPREQGTTLLAGRLPWGASALPTGEILAPCEDHRLSVLDQKGRVLAQWSAPGRFGATVSVAPRGPTQRMAVPLMGGRIEVLVWDSQTEVLAADFALTHSAEPAATAWGASGTLYAAWRDGRVEAWSPRGALLWAVDLALEVRCLLVDDALGLYAIGPGNAVLLGEHGRVAGRWPLEGSPRGVLQTMAGDLYVWTSEGLWEKGLQNEAFVRFDASSRLLGVVVDRQGELLLTEPTRLRRVSSAGLLQSVTVLPRPAITASVLDDRGRVLVGTESGMEIWTYDGRSLGVLDSTAPASAALLTGGGIAVWSDADWKVHLWSGFVGPPFGWSQEGGGPARSFDARRPASVASRATNWADDPDFGYLYQLAASEDEAKQREVLDRLEARDAQGTLLGTWPFANVLLLKVARSGLTDLQLDRNRIKNNWPALRLRAFALLARTAGPEDRDELIDLLGREFDPSVAAQGALAAARSGWDGDGKLLRLLYDLQRRMADQAVVADAVIDAARTLWSVNGRSSDPVLVPLVSSVYQGPFPRAIKQKAQTLFQALMEAP